jgi:hypothetical protein
VVLDMDSTEIMVYGEQEQSARHGHFESTRYHPVSLFNSARDCLTATGQHASCRTGRKCFCQISSANRNWARKWCVSTDAAFAKPDVYEILEQRGLKYAIRHSERGSPD